MTNGRNPFLPPEKKQGTVGSYEMFARERAVQDGLFKYWPILSKDQLGPCLVKAWKGEYETADEAFQDVRAMLGRTFAEDEEDGIEGFDWEAGSVQSDKGSLVGGGDD
jgi:hypothetical protein